MSRVDSRERVPYNRPDGYVACLACGEVAFASMLCGWCEMGSEAVNESPKSVYEAGFDESRLAVWRAAGEEIANQESCAARPEKPSPDGERLAFLRGKST